MQTHDCASLKTNINMKILLHQKMEQVNQLKGCFEDSKEKLFNMKGHTSDNIKNTIKSGYNQKKAHNIKIYYIIQHLRYPHVAQPMYGYIKRNAYINIYIIK